LYNPIISSDIKEVNAKEERLAEKVVGNPAPKILTMQPPTPNNELTINQEAHLGIKNAPRSKNG
jgi:hypothetical protein